MVQRELILASRRRGTYWTRTGVAGLVGGVLFGMAGTTSQSPVWVSQIIFRFLTVMTFGYCLFAGIHYTADALSKERREGTLGLLFLTDLRGHDVAIGKLLVSSLNAFFGLLAAIPLLAIPIMMGGVSAGEFARITFVLLNTLFFSLAAGLLVSSLGVNERNVILGTLLFLLATTFGLPLWWYNVTKIVDNRWIEFLFLFPSPAYSLKISGSGLFVAVPSDFWPCMLTIFGISVAAIATASLRLRHCVEEPNAAPQFNGRRSRSYHLTFGSDRARARLKRYMHRGFPYLWRVTRDQTMRHHVVLLTLALIVFGLFSLTFVWMNRMRGFEQVLLGWVAVHWLLKLLIAIEACKPFHEDKRLGALELLLCTRLRPVEMIAAQRRRLRRLFVLPTFFLGALNLLMAISLSDRILATAFGLGALVLLSDCWALRWAGMHYGLSCPSLTRAVFSTLWRVIVPPWIVLFVLILTIILGRNSQSEIRSFLVIWGIGSSVYACCLVAAKRWTLVRDFRCLASNDCRAVRVTRTPAGKLCATTTVTAEVAL